MKNHSPDFRFSQVDNGKRFRCNVCGWYGTFDTIPEAKKAHAQHIEDAAAGSIRNDVPILLSLPEAAQRLGVKEHAVRKLIDQGTLPKHLTDRDRRYLFGSEVDAYLAGKPMPGVPKLHTRDEAMKMLKIKTYESYRKYVASGRLQVIRVGGDHLLTGTTIRSFRKNPVGAPARRAGAPVRQRPEDRFITRTISGRYMIKNPLGGPKGRIRRTRGRYAYKVRFIPSYEYPVPEKDRYYRTEARKYVRKVYNIPASYSGTRHKKGE